MAKKKSASAKKQDTGTRATSPVNSPADRSEAKSLNIVVTLADNAVERFDAIRKQLQKSGMTIETPLAGLGQYIGTSSDAAVAQLAAIKGVAAVEQLGEVHLPPSPLDPQ